MRCRGCNHLSPIMPKAVVNPAELVADLAFLASMIHVPKLLIMGGEPLLHPEIDRVLEAARSSGLGDRLEVLTNGKLLSGMSPEFWALVDSVIVSAYPGIEFSWPREYEDKVQVVKTVEFNESFSATKNEDVALLKSLWDGCGIRNVSFGLVNRHFYKCMRSAYIPRAVGLPPTVDGISLEGLTEKALIARIRDAQPLEACRYCTASSGKAFAHEELPQESWRASHQKPVRELLKR